MSNPNWPNFPGVANLTQDADGRPQTVDLYPGKNRGTLLNSLFFNPLLRKICDLQDGADNAISGLLGVSFKDGDVPGISLFWQGVSAAPCFVRRDPSGTTVFTALITQEQVNDRLAAVNAAVNAESQRAQDAENSRVSKTGDVVTGNLVLNSGNAYGPWAASPQNIFEVGGGLLSIWGQVFGNGNVGFLLGGNNPGQPYRNWRFDPTLGMLTTPNWNPVPEVSGLGMNRVVEQVFVVTGMSAGGTNGESWVSFPNPFAAGQTPILSITINREPGLVSRAVSLGNQNGSNQPNVTNTGFSFQPWFASGGNINTSGQPWTLHVRAIGVM